MLFGMYFFSMKKYFYASEHEKICLFVSVYFKLENLERLIITFSKSGSDYQIQ